MQNPNQMISKTMIFDEVALSLRNMGKSEEEIREKVEETLKVCGLFPFRNWPVSALSFGQKKRVTIASVLVQDPELIILDEPTRGIDIGAKTQIYHLMRELAKQGKAIIMISSELPEVIGMSDNIVVMFEGKITGTLSGDGATQDEIMRYAENVG